VTSVTPQAGLVGTEPPNGVFELTVVGTITGYSVSEAEPRATTITKLKQQADPEYDINEDAAAVAVVIGPTLVDNGVQWRVRASTSQFAQVKEAPLRTALAGREFSEVEAVLDGQGLKVQRITIWPGWWPRFPFFDSRLRIEVDKQPSAASP
jgi:hypothetical protein